MKFVSARRNVAVGLGVAVLLLAPLGCNYFSENAPPDEIVNVVQGKLDVPAGLEKSFTDLGVKGLILVGGTGKKDDPFTIRVVTPNGAPIDLCGSGSDSDKSSQPCKLTTTAAQLLNIATPESISGTCSDGATRRQCHKDGPNKNKWYFHSDPDGNKHHTCLTACR